MCDHLSVCLCLFFSVQSSGNVWVTHEEMENMATSTKMVSPSGWLPCARGAMHMPRFRSPHNPQPAAPEYTPIPLRPAIYPKSALIKPFCMFLCDLCPVALQIFSIFNCICDNCYLVTTTDAAAWCALRLLWLNWDQWVI